MALVGYIILTPSGALPSAVLLTGNFTSAFSMQTREATASDVSLAALVNPTNSTIYRITEDVPYEKATGSELEIGLFIDSVFSILQNIMVGADYH